MWTFFIFLAMTFFICRKTASSKDPCEEDWEKYGDKCYYFSNSTASWEDALEACEDVGGHLARVNNKGEMKYLGGKCKSYGKMYWIGGTDKCKEGVWVWETLGQPVSYNAWISGQPDNYRNEDCMEIWPSHQRINDDHAI